MPHSAPNPISPTAIIECYGKYQSRREDCRQCAYVEYCRQATEDDNRGPAAISFAEVEYSEEFADAAVLPDLPLEPVLEFSRQDLLEVISFMVCMDAETLSMLDLKIKNPTISFADLGRERDVSRQAVHKFILKKCQEVPELVSVLHQRQNKVRQGGTNSFMEAVWEIRQQTSGRKSKKPSAASKSFGTLMSLTRNLDLSRLSIYSGDRNCISD